MKKNEAEDLIIPKHDSKHETLDHHIEEEETKCAEHRELRKDKKYITKIDKILCYHDKSIPLHVLIVVTFREKDCVIHIPEVYA